MKLEWFEIVTKCVNWSQKSLDFGAFILKIGEVEGNEIWKLQDNVGKRLGDFILKQKNVGGEMCDFVELCT